MIDKLVKLYEDKRELTLLEIAYFAISIISFFIAAILALFNQALGVSILIVPFCALIAGVMNIVAWALVKLVIEELVKSKKKPAAKSADKSAQKTTKK